MDIDKKTGPCYICLKRLNHHFQPLFLAKKRIRVPVREGPNYILRLFLRKSKIENRSNECIRHKTATLKITRFSLSLDIPISMHICYSPVGRPGLGETVPEVLSNALDRPAASGGTQTEGTVSPNMERSRPVNYIFIFFLL